MPLTRCPDCAREISDLAPACVYCGRPRVDGQKPTSASTSTKGVPQSLNCPQCGSLDVQRLALVHAGGITSFHGEISSIGIGAGSNGLGVGGGVSELSGSQQSNLSKIAAPPATKVSGCQAKTVSLVFGWFAAFIVLSIVLSALSVPVGPGFVVAWVLASVVAIVAAKRTQLDDPKVAEWNRTEYPKLLARWERSFMCGRCGQVFENLNTRQTTPG